MSIPSTSYQSRSLLTRTILLPSQLCLDAPLVAISWSTAIEFLQTRAIASVYPHLGLFLVVWVIYLFDRLYDTRPRAAGKRESLRHQFAYRHRPLLSTLMATSMIACGLIALSGKISARFLQPAVFLAGAVLLYFSLFRFLKGSKKALPIPSKEIAISLCFAGGICIAGAATSLAEFFPLFTVLFLNCLIIARSEAGEDSRVDPIAFYSNKKSITKPYLEYFLALAVLVACWFLANPLPIRMATVLSALLLLATGFIKPIRRRTQILADAALLTPWPVICFFQAMT